jgi:nitrite reductase/ring-hydroxylating ferredoxin subunit
MLARWLTHLMDAQRFWTKPVGDWVHGIDNTIFSAVPQVRDLISGRWLGHPMHAVITDAPIGNLFLVIVFDVLGQPVAATWTLVIGILAMIAAAIAGLADYADTDGTPRERATLHATLMTSALILYVLSGVGRIGSGGGPIAVWLSIVAFLVLSAGAYVGGDVVYVLGNMINRHAWRGAGVKWISLEPAEVDADGRIPEGRPVKAKLGINQLVLVRQGENILALHDVCAHAGGPLNEGRLVDGQIECPWHFSRYEMATGHLRQGPSVYDQPAYEVRARDGGGWEARRQPA